MLPLIYRSADEYAMRTTNFNKPDKIDGGIGVASKKIRLATNVVSSQLREPVPRR